MDINFVLNDCPISSTSSRSADTAFNIGGIGGTTAFKVRPQHSGSSSFFSHSPTTAEHHLSQLVSAYKPYQHSNNPSTTSSRGSHSGPSLRSSTTATSPLEIAMASHHSAASANVDNAYSGSSEMGESITGPGSSFPGRLLPPLNSVNSHPPILPTSGEVALSPRSTSHHYHHQITSDAGNYFSSAPSHSYTYGSQYQPSVYLSSQQNHGNGYDTLLSFAEVAMGTATPSGRRSLEVEAAAEALATRRESGGSQRHFDPGARSSNHIVIDNNKSFQMDIDPELRPASAGSVASTGRTIEEEESMIKTGDTHPLQTQRSSMATNIIDIAYNRDTPLFRPTPEVSTPRQEPVAISTDAGPSTVASTGPLHIPSSPHDFLNQAPKCSYCSICTTGSPLRKVVSHIFGRNKLSTRQIPKNVWVYYCRKHYQRSRYRNPRGFARQQVLLVRRQCERLELWGGVKDWVIKVRRREELRMNREGGENGDEMDDEDELEDNTAGDDEPEANDGGPTSGESSRRNSTATARRRSSTGGNNWIMRHTGMEKTINDIYRLLEKIEIEVQENGGKFPDVELLPNVDLAMAVSIRGPDGDEGGNTGGDENQEGVDDEGVAGRSVGKKRRRSDGGSGSSGGDDARGTKKTKSTAVKKGGDRKGKGKAPPRMEAAPDEKVPSQSKGAHGFSPEVLHHEVDDMANVARIEGVAVFTGRGAEHQTFTPPPSTSTSTERSTPELESESKTKPDIQKSSIAGSSYLLSPRHNPSSTITETSGGYLRHNSIGLPSSETYIDTTHNLLWSAV